MSASGLEAKPRGAVFRNLGWQAFSNLGVAAIGGAYILYIGRSLGVVRFGLYVLVTAIATVGFAATDLRAHEGIVKFLSNWEARSTEAAVSLRTLAVVDSFWRLGIAIALAAASPLLAALLLHGQGGAGLVLVAVTGTFLAKLGNNAATGVLRVFGRFDWQATVLLSSWVIKLLATVALVTLHGAAVLPILLISFACDIAANALLIGSALRGLKRTTLWQPLRAPQRGGVAADIRHFLSSGLGISLADSFVRELDTAVVGWSMPLHVVGLYRMAKNIVTLVWRGLDPVSVVLMPEFAHLVAVGDYARIARIGRHATVIVFCIALLALLGGAVVLPYLVPLILGPEFLGAVHATLIMLTGLLIGAPLIWYYALWVAAGELHMYLRANVVSALVVGTLFLTLTPRFGLNGAAIAFGGALSLPFVASCALWHLRGARRVMK